MAEKIQIDLSTMEGQTAAWENTYAAMADGTIDAAAATNRIRVLRGVYILRVEGPSRMLGLLAKLGKDSDLMRTHAETLTRNVMTTLSALPSPDPMDEKKKE
jgi:hypothetical protein